MLDAGYWMLDIRDVDICELNSSLIVRRFIPYSYLMSFMALFFSLNLAFLKKTSFSQLYNYALEPNQVLVRI
jgi:hypothetical protein